MERVLKYMFNDAIAIELMAAGIYKDFEVFFAYIPDIMNFWKSLHDDELNHAEILKETRDSLLPSVLDSTVENLMWENIHLVRKKMMRYQKENIKTLDDAYELTHEIESSEINAIFKFLNLEYFSTPLRESFIASEIMTHQKKMLEFSEKFGPKLWRKEIMIRIV